MADYVKREYAIDAVLDIYYDTPDIDLSGEKFEEAIRKIQAADVVPVRHGKWLPTTKWWQGGSAWKQCSECGILHLGKSNFCPNCGAKMDLEEQHELRRDL